MDEIRRPALPWHGRCQCGNVSYTVTREPLTLYECHCTECQKQSSSGHGMSMRLPFDGLRIEGDVSVFVRDEGEPTEVHGLFCGRCGARIAHRRPTGTAINLKPGTLDDTSWLTPVGYLWTRSAQKGAIFDPALLRYETQPDGYDDLIDAWSRRSA